MKKKLLTIGLVAMLSFFVTGIDKVEAGGATLNADQTGGVDVASIASKEVSGKISTNPFAAQWESAPTTVVSLLPQDVTEPKEFAPAVTQVAVSVLRNPCSVAIRLQWKDVSKDTAALRHDDYRDGAALMFPMKPTDDTVGDEVQGVLPFMGDDGNAVNIWHWKADWEREGSVEVAFKDGTYPNMQADYYINETAGQSSIRAANSNTGTGCSDCVGNSNPCSGSALGMGSESAGQTLMTGTGDHEGVFDAGEHSKNILSTESLRASSVEDLNAEGFGTLTTQASQDVSGYGAHGNNSWSVVFVRSVSTKDSNDVQFSDFSGAIPVAFAVWEGSNGERNGMKGRSTWHWLKLK
tara:strand:- start:9300 stop:10355 length:1056 start_codon:yes stop_codon:yes gene_type:complete